MAKEDIAPYQQNLAIKQAFTDMDLDLNEVMEFTPFNLDLENRRLFSLFYFVKAYQKHGSREAMETVCDSPMFPPVFPMISPENDWFRFELWVAGKPTRMKLSAQLPKSFVVRRSEDLREEEIDEAMAQLEAALDEIGYGIGIRKPIPPRLRYEYLLETLEETFELDVHGGWFIDGCSGFCPGCFQRPWCDVGLGSCWPEDEAAGKMSLIDMLRPYVSPSPQSLQILQRLQAEEDAKQPEFVMSSEVPPGFEDFPFDDSWKALLN